MAGSCGPLELSSCCPASVLNSVLFWDRDGMFQLRQSVLNWRPVILAAERCIGMARNTER